MSSSNEHGWGFLSNHGHVLLVLHQDGDVRQRDIARAAGLTEGAVRRILTELQDAGYVTIERIGRRNRYQTDPTRNMRHPIESAQCIGPVLQCLAPGTSDSKPMRTAS